MTTGDYEADIRALLEKHLPRDTDPVITQAVVEGWLPRIIAAEYAEVQGPKRDRLALVFQAKDGSVLARIESPVRDAKSLRDFYVAWRKCRERYGLNA